MINHFDIAYSLGIGLSSPFWLARPSSRRKVLTAFSQRMGYVPARDLSKPGIMIHAVSLGEINATRSLINVLRAGRPGIEFIVSVTTETGFARGRELPAFDFQIPLQGLPRLFKTDLTNIPSAVPYLKVPPEDRLRWKDRVQGDGRLKVGLAWAGSPRRKMSDEIRTRGLDVLAPLGQSPNVRFFSLQKGPESSLARPPGLELTDFTQDLNDFADTAALIENLDLVISVDTSVAHLAGALAKTVWVLIPYSSDFRWLLERTDSPWYPTMRLFRQRRRDDWQSVVAEVAAALKEVCAGNCVR